MIEDELIRQQIDVIDMIPGTHNFNTNELKYLYHGSQQNYKVLRQILISCTDIFSSSQSEIPKCDKIKKVIKLFEAYGFVSNGLLSNRIFHHVMNEIFPEDTNTSLIEIMFRIMWGSDNVMPHMNDLLEGNQEYITDTSDTNDPLIRCDPPQEIFNGAQMPYSDEFRAVCEAYSYVAFKNFMVPLNTVLSKYNSVSNEGEINSITIGNRKASYLASMINRNSTIKYAYQALFNVLHCQSMAELNYVMDESKPKMPIT